MHEYIRHLYINTQKFLYELKPLKEDCCLLLSRALFLQFKRGECGNVVQPYLVKHNTINDNKSEWWLLMPNCVSSWKVIPRPSPVCNSPPIWAGTCCTVVRSALGSCVFCCYTTRVWPVQDGVRISCTKQANAASTFLMSMVGLVRYLLV